MRAKHLIVPICLFVGFSVSSSFAQQVVKTVTSGASEKIKVFDKKFISVSAALWGLTILDAETTHSCVAAGTCREGNPVMRPFFKAGRPATYGFYTGVNSALLYSSYRLRKSSNPTARKLWWVAPLAATAAHIFAGANTLVRFSFR